MDRSPEFVEAIARGLDVIRVFGATHRSMSLSEVAAATDLARPTARRILLTLADLGYVRIDDRAFSLTPKVLDLGMSYIESASLWDVAREHLRDLVVATGQSCSIGVLDGGDVVYVARVAVPKLVTLTVHIGTRFPAPQTSLGKVLLAALEPAELEVALSTPSTSGVVASWQPSREEILTELRQVRAQGWALTDQQLAPAIRSIATGIRDGEGRVIAGANVNAHAAETSLETLVDVYLPLLLRAANAISADVSRIRSVPAELIQPARSGETPSKS